MSIPKSPCISLEMKSSGFARVIECSCLVWRRKNCFQVFAFRSSRGMSQQGHLFRHSFLQGTVAISQSVHPLEPRHAPRASHHIHLLGCISHTRGTGGGLRSPVLPLSLPPQEITVCNLMPALQERRESLSQSARLLLLYLFCAGLAYTGSLKQSQISRPSWPGKPYPKQTQVIL